MKRLSLQGAWEIVERPLTTGPEASGEVAAAEATLAGQVPGDVTDCLVRAGKLPEPLVGTNFTQCRWVEERSWWWRKRFRLPADWADADSFELVLDGLDIHADIWLDGTFLGHHGTVFRPFASDVTKLLRAGAEHILLVRLTTGLERVPNDHGFALASAVPTEGSRGYPERGDQRRIFLRKPAYVWGWDWGPHVATCGITMDAFVRARQPAEIERVALRASLDGDTARVSARVDLDYATLIASSWADITVTLTDEDGLVHRVTRCQTFVASGLNPIDLELTIPCARLWWPNGSGAQHRYRVEATARLADGSVAEFEPFLWGLRTVELVVEPERFYFRVNGEPIFLKGGNWIPADSIYGRITPAKATTLVEEAAEANFNCLRIWGGGRFEQDAFYEACDRRGILVWHDFMSACAPLPAHLDSFREEFMREAEYQVRRLHNRACLALWCGNNEVSQIYAWNQFRIDKDPGWVLYHRLLPRLVHEQAPHIPYWPTSPYGGVDKVHDPRIGDDHHWIVMRKEPEFWSSPEYWDNPAVPIFNSEYGYGGPCCRASMEQYLGTTDIDLGSEAVRQHTNTFYDMPRVRFSIEEHYRDAAGLSLDDYILLGGLCQGLNLGYSLEALRANCHTMGGIFWMYDDTWGENGWTIIDYYLRRKVSYYNVKRSLAPARLVLRRGGQAYGGREGEVLLLLLNDGPKPLAGTLQFGYLSWDGTTRYLAEVAYHVPGRSRQLVGKLPVPLPEELANGTLVAIPEAASTLAPVSWRHCRYRDAHLPPAQPCIDAQRVDGGDLLVTLRSDRFAHAAYLDLAADWRLSDHYVDLLPGVPHEIRIYGGADLARQPLGVTAVNADSLSQ